MLSSQTKDEITAKAMLELKKLPLEIDAILAADQEKIAQAIYPVSFYKVKNSLHRKIRTITIRISVKYLTEKSRVYSKDV